MKVPLSKVSFDFNEKNTLIKIFKSGWLTHGEYNIKFEKKFSDLIKSNYSLTLNSCTSALELAIKCQNIKGEIIVPSFTWVSSVNAILNSGAIPVLCDSDLKTRNVTADLIEPLITKKTQAIMIVHYGGQCCEMDEIVKLCKSYKLKLIEDSAETLGGTWKGRQAGSWGVGCFSFFPTKNISTGEGGMITCSDKSLFSKFKLMAAHGISTQSIEREKKKSLPWHKIAKLAGHNYRMSNLLAGLGLEQLKKIKKLNFSRRKSAKLYFKLIKKYSLPITIPYEHPKARHVYQTYAINVNKNIRDRLLFFLRKKGIGASVHFTPPLHKHSFFKKKCKIRTSLKNAEYLSDTMISLPMHSNLRNTEVEYVCKTLKSFFKKN
ncbi:DegT/DnrJ/EryC1/StrS family aminotransferase [Candidatus Pelagibacter bacterium]|nr:DegT/DnrJ/EryC1/StrS family aminotransferase [Candidatus Pelagibacter bacterium]